MKVTADTSLLVRLAVRDEETQARIAFEILASAEKVMVPLPSLVEFVWVPEKLYRVPWSEVAAAVLALVDWKNVATDAAAVDAGLKVHAAGGDFADGAIASAGAATGADAFGSFDQEAVKRIASIGLVARHAGSPV